jgi:hypothetical protein
MGEANKTVDHWAREGARLVLPLVPIKLKRSALYWRSTRKPLPKNPQSYSEKIQWRIVNDRRELIARGGDKLAMKKHAAETSSSVLVPETLWHGKDLASIYDRDWGCDWVLKPVTGSGYVEFGNGSLRGAGVDLGVVAKWRQYDQFRVHGEWAYGQAAPGYLIERRIQTADGALPNDHRFFVFDGQVRLVQVDTPRFDGVRRRFYTPRWVPLDVRQGGKPLADVVPAPARLGEMIRIASEIGAAYDFIRVDLYDTDGGVYFGELTPYPTSGMGKFSPPSFDQELGKHWTLPRLP